jgi:hypothetical protein
MPPPELWTTQRCTSSGGVARGTGYPGFGLSSFGCNRVFLGGLELEILDPGGYILFLIGTGFLGGGIFVANAALWAKLAPVGGGQGGMI